MSTEMTYSQLGGSGLTVSTVGLGCNNFGARMADDDVPAVVNAAIEAGITLFDTADVYGNCGGSETPAGQGSRHPSSRGHHRDQVRFRHAGANGPDWGARVHGATSGSRWRRVSAGSIRTGLISTSCTRRIPTRRSRRPGGTH